ncbi:hypothetical protein [Actinomadura madurae]|uniref:Uncharacterized protein n=1 Tax=Actinomadura madurae TaxID=1993 RepID=A0A1I5WK87_9ACTN|nr:hypothetical protein [Actinomadura madurae]SFQ19987.1 hypothetical protein SAMN04489713_1242 [Actinomadura madurae]SPT51840.1 Uncharacterised protein [Actinomadura madurae]
MGNTISGGGRGRDLYMSNGGTEVFVEVLMLAVSALASREWDLRFAGLIALQDQAVFGRGAVGFDLKEIDWGDSLAKQAVNREFVQSTIGLALGRHRWDELGYDPPFAEGYLLDFRQVVNMFDPSTAVPDPLVFPVFKEVVALCCARHRVLTPLRAYTACVFCERDY